MLTMNKITNKLNELYASWQFTSTVDWPFYGCEQNDTDWAVLVFNSYKSNEKFHANEYKSCSENGAFLPFDNRKMGIYLATALFVGLLFFSLLCTDQSSQGVPK